MNMQQVFQWQYRCPLKYFSDSTDAHLSWLVNKKCTSHLN